MSNILIDFNETGGSRVIDPNGVAWLFDVAQTNELFAYTPAQSNHGECGSDTLEISDTIMGEHIEYK